MRCEPHLTSPRRGVVAAAVVLTLWLGWGQGPGVAAAGQAPSDPATTFRDVGVTGVVFEDRNGNGRCDGDEPRVAGVLVSDQIHVVPTGPDGRYHLEPTGGYGFVVLSLPAGYRSPGAFWRRIAPDAAAEDVDFPLVRVPRVSKFTFLHASDPHLSEQSLDRMRRLRELVVSLQPDFVLMTGDLIRDAPGVGEDEARQDYELFVREIAAFPVPVWAVLGNHDVFGIERHKSLVSPEHPLYGKQMYRHYLGPNYYSFDYGGVHFVALDTVGYEELWYYGHVDETQLAWLEEDLSHLAAGTAVVAFSHIPLFSASPTLWGYTDEPLAPSLITIDGQTHFRHTVGNAREVLAALRGHRFTLALSGHVHMRETLFYEAAGVRARYHQASALVGDLPDAAGMRMVSGVTLYRVRDGEIDDGTFIPLDEASAGTWAERVLPVHLSPVARPKGWSPEESTRQVRLDGAQAHSE